MASKKELELEQKIESLTILVEYTERECIAADKDRRKIGKQLECGLELHSCAGPGLGINDTLIHQGHLFQFKSRIYAACDGSWHKMAPFNFADPNIKDAGRFECKFCGITAVRRMTIDELKAADTLSIGD